MMEENRGWALAGGGVGAGGDNNATLFNFNPVTSSSSYYDGSLQSLIPFPPSDFWPASYSSYYLPTDPTGPNPNPNFISSSSSSSGEHHRLPDFSYYNHLGHPPQSQCHYFNTPCDSGQGQAQSFDFFSCTSLPGLRFPESPSDQKRLRPDHFLTNPQSFNFPQKDRPSGFAPDNAVLNGQMARRSSSRNISDKTRCLQKLMPWEKKVDNATLLEEAHKYVRFLQAQIKALQIMPVFSSNGHDCGVGGGEFGVLGMLNKQQLLEVLLNSPAAQSRLSTRGLCVYSIEQLVLLTRLAERGSL